MKRLMLVWVMMLCMVLSCGAAQAVDWDRYAIDADTAYDSLPFPNSEDVITRTRDYDLVWKRGTAVVATLRRSDYPNLRSNVSIHWLPDKRCGVLMSYVPLHPEKTDEYAIDYGIWSEDGFTMLRRWKGDGCRAVSCSRGVLITSVSGEDVLIDLYGETLWSGTVRVGTLRRAQGLRMLSADDWVCSLIDYNKFTGGDDRKAYVRMTDGEVAWARYVSDNSMVTPLDDGNSVLIEYRNDGKYGPVDITLLDAADHDIVSRRVSGSRVITDAMAPVMADDGSLIIYGSAVANSRRVYLAWRLNVGRDLSLISLDVRNAEYHGDYSLHSRVYEDDCSCLLWLKAYDGSGAPDVIIPFDALPVSIDHTLRYE